MVRVETLFVNGASESFEPVGEVAGEPDRHVRCTEGRHHLEPGCLQRPGGYRFGDYWKLGLPLMGWYAIIAIAVVPLIWRF